MVDMASETIKDRQQLNNVFKIYKKIIMLNPEFCIKE